MELRACRVTVADTSGGNHSVEVTAGTLYEAVALGLAALRSDSWADELVHGDVRVSVRSVEAEHTVKIAEFYQWIERSGGSPAEKSRRRRIKEILGIASE